MKVGSARSRHFYGESDNHRVAQYISAVAIVDNGCLADTLPSQLLNLDQMKYFVSS